MKKIRLTGVKPDYAEQKIAAIRCLRQDCVPTEGARTISLKEAKAIADLVYAGGQAEVEVTNDYPLSFIFIIEPVKVGPQDTIPRDVVIDFLLAAIASEAAAGSKPPLKTTPEFKTLRELL